jgi:S1-C subfamily serine protease
MENALQTLSNGLADAVDRAAKSIVTVHARRRPISGVVHSADLILTIDHVLEGEDTATVTTFDGRKLEAQVVGRDPGTDLALLRVKDGNLEPATVAADAARVGQFALLVARPDGIMASHGIVSQVGGPLRMGRGVSLEQFIRTDAVPYPGFSGGAMVDASGAVLGVTNAGLARGLGLAIPAALAWKVGAALVSGGVKRGWLGIGSQPVKLPDGGKQAVGLLIVSVEPGSPAASGLMLGDVLVVFDGHAISDTDELQALLIGDRVGKAIPVEVIRAGKPETVQITIGERPAHQRPSGERGPRRR